MDSLAGYGSEEENDTMLRNKISGSGGSSKRRGDDHDDNYDDVNMDMSEGSESEPELPPADAEPAKPEGNSKNNDYHNDKDRPPRNDRDGRDRRRHDIDRRDNRNDNRPRSDRERDRRDDHGSRKGLLGDRPDDRKSMDRRTSSSGSESQTRSYDARDAVSPRFVDRDRRDKDSNRERDNNRDRDRSSRDRTRDRGDERRHRYNDRRSRSRERSDRSKSRGFPPPESLNSERRTSPSNEYRPSYKVNKKLQVMEKMGLQIKTPDGSMTTAQQLRQAANELPASSSGGFFMNSAGPAAKVLDQVNKRKLLWANKAKSEAEEAAKWSGTKFAQDDDGKQTSKFMRLMGIKDGAPVQSEESKSVDPIKKQEEMFQAMQAQYEVARATTHTMRGVGLGFQRGPL